MHTFEVEKLEGLLFAANNARNIARNMLEYIAIGGPDPATLAAQLRVASEQGVAIEVADMNAEEWYEWAEDCAIALEAERERKAQLKP